MEATRETTQNSSIPAFSFSLSKSSFIVIDPPILKMPQCFLLFSMYNNVSQVLRVTSNYIEKVVHLLCVIHCHLRNVDANHSPCEKISFLPLSCSCHIVLDEILLQGPTQEPCTSFFLRIIQIMRNTEYRKYKIYSCIELFVSRTCLSPSLLFLPLGI